MSNNRSQLSQDAVKAKDKIVDSVRDLNTAKITVPLGNPNLKLVHTNQMLFTELPVEAFELANFEVISKALNSIYTRYGTFVLNRWYVETVNITNDGKNPKMDIEVNPVPSTVLKFRDDVKSFETSYEDTLSSNNSQGSTGETKVKSVPQTVKLQNVKGFNKSDQEFIKKVVTKALKKRNNPYNPLPIAFAIYDYYRDHHVYSKYDCMKKIRAHGFEGAWKLKDHNCGDGAATIVAMMRCANLDADIMHKPGHFYVRVEIDGKYYYCDQAGAGGHHNNRELGSAGNDKNVWRGISKSASVVGFKYC